MLRLSRDGSRVETMPHVGTPEGLSVAADDEVRVADALALPSLVRVTLDGTAHMTDG